MLVEMLSFLQNISKQLRGIQERRSEDRLDHFGKLVASEL